jgi:hypothetical protein
MTLRSYKLAINKPCEENWLDMTTNEQGKYCAQCCKTVIDFSILSDDEIVKVLNNSSAELCGRLSPQQLNREIHNSAKTTPVTYNWWYNVASSILLLVTAKQAEAKAPELIANQHITQQYSLTTPAITTTDSITIKGKVVDSTGEPVPFVKVNIIGTSLHTTTDFDGNFKFKINQNSKDEKWTLEFTSAGYLQQTREVSIQKGKSIKITIGLTVEADFKFMQDSTNNNLVVGMMTKGRVVFIEGKKVPKKSWQFWKRN